MAPRWLPDGIMLQIILESDVRTIKDLRLSCRRYFALTETYSKAVSSAICSQHETIWKYFKIVDSKEKPLQVAFEVDRRIQVAKWIAAMALRDRKTLTPQEAGVSQAIHPRVDLPNIFDSLVRGVGIVWHLSSLYNAGSPEDRQGIRSWTAFYPSSSPSGVTTPPIISDITSSPSISTDNNTAWRQFGYTTPPPSISTDNDLAWRQFDYICSVDNEGLKGLYHFDANCMELLYGWNVGNRDSHGPSSGLLCQWYSWFILQQGPEFFVAAWSSEKGNEKCAKMLLDARDTRTVDQYRHEAEWLQEVIRQRYHRALGDDFNDHVEVVVESEAERGKMIQKWIEESGLESAKVQDNDWRTTALTLRWTSVAAERNAEKNERKKRTREERILKRRLKELRMTKGANRHRFGDSWSQQQK